MSRLKRPLQMRHGGIVSVLITTVFMFAWPAGGYASTWDEPVDKGAVQGRDLSKVTARGEVVDRTLKRGKVRASSHVPSRVEDYTDGHGHTIRIGTSIDGLDLRPFAAVLAGTLHTDEMSDLRVLVVNRDELSVECGGTPGDGVIACYGADDPQRLFSGEMVIPSSHPDLYHAMIHEYGHHLDNARLNLAHLGFACDFSQDGSRRWFFARDADDDLFGLSGCDDRVSYGRLLFELFAEDFVALHGIDEWFVSEFPPPIQKVLDALYDDILDPFEPSVTRYQGAVGPRRQLRLHVFRIEVPTFFSARLVGSGGRRNDLDLHLWRRGARRALEESRRRGSRETVERLLAPGRYEIGAYASEGRGRYRVAVSLN